MSKPMAILRSLRKEVLEGRSGVKHEVNVVDLEDEKYVLLDCRSLKGDISVELIKNLIICFDTDLPLLLLINERPGLLSIIEHIKQLSKLIKIKIIRCD
ncbi:MAG TPA: hypothetical protein EYH40_00190 [Desulfurococcales archaeon]|nr:hypothetical protein [Desulfurococcales archaeon]